MEDQYRFVLPIRGRRLLDFENSQETHIARIILSSGLRVGDGLASCGLPSDHFFRLEDVYSSSVSREELTAFHILLIEKIRQVMELESIGFIGLVIRQRAGNKAGIEQIGGLLAKYGMSFFQVRLSQRLWARALDPQMARNIRVTKPRILLLGDTSFSGSAIYEAAVIIRRAWRGLGLMEKPEISAFVIYDYLRGAREKLQMKDIELYSLIDWLFFWDLRLVPENMDMRRPAPRILFESAAVQSF